ncbi:Mif2/CENP-C like-domain-containing protein [Blyttiomyces helicus]|uniref:CENP-C homolog n=1 Tax=Blyttiomyces helicus TaxID=388810 RepID=A0A4P9WCZ9_9FUNG|nr:Mif2/CENP-C like-domain-containing protein [Blyttiomyces helicus]|eukprot:RKO90212.1 Mif2/CENP-C like-domain-containing protein [Blyttiomyces helicus]
MDGDGNSSNEEADRAPSPPRASYSRAREPADGTKVKPDPDAPARRSRRDRVAPLQYWRNERIVGLKRRQSEPGLIQKKVAPPLGDEEDIKKKKRIPVAASAVPGKRVIAPRVAVINFETGKEEKQCVVTTPDMIHPENTGTGDFKYHRLYSDSDFFSSGILWLPKGATKPNKNTRDAAMFFYVIAGQIEVTIHRSTFKISTGATFFVPRGNQYCITNVGPKESKIAFSVGKNPSMYEEAA